MFKSPSEIALTFGSIDIYWYGIIMSASILIGLFVTVLATKKYFKDISFDTICDLSFYVIVFGIIFARLYYVVFDYEYFIKHPAEIIAIWNGGISVQGAIIGGITAGYLYVKKYKLNFLRLADLFSFGLITGQILGRWGNFFNSEAFGLPADLPWKLYIPYSHRPDAFKDFEFFHPAFLYESILNIFVLLILFCMISKLKNRKDGQIFFSYIILYSIVRLLVETVRVDSVFSIGPVHIAHIMSVIFIIAGILGLKHVNNRVINL